MKGAQAVEQRAVAALVPYARNARTHSERQVALIARSIERYGFNNPILVDGQNGIVAGHGRLAAARILGLESVPVIELAHLSERERREYILADNKIAERAGWDDTLLQLEAGELTELGAELTDLGFLASDVDRLLRPEFQDADETLPTLGEHVISRAGDIWALGAHRLACGDATDPVIVSALLDGARPHLMVTDPPYGVEYDPAWRDRAGLECGATLEVKNDDRADWTAAWKLFPGCVAYVWHSALHGLEVARSLDACGFQIRAQIVWVKQRAAISRGHYHWAHEPAFFAVQDGADDRWRFEEDHEGLTYAVREGDTARWRGGRRQSTVWEIAHLKNDTGHGTQKPLECMRRPILNNSVAGDAIYEPFSGSGTTIIAAEQTGRRCFAIELDPRYCDLAVKRWQIVTGANATRVADGASFNDLESKWQSAGRRRNPRRSKSSKATPANGGCRKSPQSKRPPKTAPRRNT